MVDNVEGRVFFEMCSFIIIIIIISCKTIAVRIYRVKFDRLWDTIDKNVSRLFFMQCTCFWKVEMTLKTTL